MKKLKFILVLLVGVILFFFMAGSPFAGDLSYTTEKISWVTTYYVTINMNDKNIKSILMIVGAICVLHNRQKRIMP